MKKPITISGIIRIPKIGKTKPIIKKKTTPKITLKKTDVTTNITFKITNNKMIPNRISIQSPLSCLYYNPNILISI